MALYTIIPDSDLDPDSPITTGLMTAYRENIKEASPTGMIIDLPLPTPPSGFLMCDGSAISRSSYAALFAVYGTYYGVGDGSTTFNLPLRSGYHPRGWDNGAGNDPDAATRTDRGDGTGGDVVGSKQGSQFTSHNHGGGNHRHTLNGSSYGSGTLFGSSPTSGTKYSNYSGTIISSNGGNETRGLNVYTNYCCRYTGA